MKSFRKTKYKKLGGLGHLIALAWYKTNLIVEIVIDDTEALLLDIANDGGSGGASESQAKG